MREVLKFKRCDINVLEPGWEELKKLVEVQVNIRVIFVHVGMVIVIHTGNECLENIKLDGHDILGLARFRVPRWLRYVKTCL